MLDTRVPVGGFCGSLNTVEAASSFGANGAIQGLLMVPELPTDIGNPGSMLRPRVSVTVKGLLEVHYFNLVWRVKETPILRALSFAHKRTEWLCRGL